MSELLKINVNDHIEKKNGLSYLSWAWAWAEVLKIDPAATWVAHEFGPDGCQIPFMVLPDTTAMVKVGVTINGGYKVCLLPVMDHRNKAIPGPNAFQVNTAIMRCLAKAISMHGLGLYIYAGEDLPEEDKGEVKDAKKIVHQPAMAGIGDDLPQDDKTWLQEIAFYITGLVNSGKADVALAKIQGEYNLDDTQTLFMQRHLDSKVRTALRNADKKQPEAAT